MRPQGDEGRAQAVRATLCADNAGFRPGRSGASCGGRQSPGANEEQPQAAQALF